MQEIQLLLVQTQTVVAQLAFQVVATLGLVLAWLVVALGRKACVPAWRGLMVVTARLAIALGLLWLTVLAVAWPPMLERTGNVLGPIVAGVAAIMLVADAAVQCLVPSPAGHRRPALQSAGALLLAIGVSVALMLALLALAWMAEPAGAVLIDGRYQVTQWSDMLGSQEFLLGLLATGCGALLLLAALAQVANQSDRSTALAMPEAWQRAAAGLGVAGLLGLLWLLSRIAGMQLNPVTQTTQTFYEALLAGSDNGVLRATFVLWLATLAGLVASLGMAAGAAAGEARAQTQTEPEAPGRLGAAMRRLTVFGAPVLWALVCWQVFARQLQSQMADLPVADLASMQPVAVLAFGLALVVVVVVMSFWVLWRFVRRLAQLAGQDSLVKAADSPEAETAT